MSDYTGHHRPPSLSFALSGGIFDGKFDIRQRALPPRRASAIAATSIIARLAVAEKKEAGVTGAAQVREQQCNTQHIFGEGCRAHFLCSPPSPPPFFWAQLRPPPPGGSKFDTATLSSSSSFPCWNRRATMRTSKDGVRGGPVSLFFSNRACVTNSGAGKTISLHPRSLCPYSSITVSFPLP